MIMIIVNFRCTRFRNIQFFKKSFYYPMEFLHVDAASLAYMLDPRYFGQNFYEEKEYRKTKDAILDYAPVGQREKMRNELIEVQSQMMD